MFADTRIRLIKLLGRAFSTNLAKKIPKGYKLQKALYNLLKPKGIILAKFPNNSLFLNMQDRGVVPELLTYGIFEPFETEVVKENLKEGMTFVDIGANIGYYSMIAAQKVGDKGMVLAFEPENANFELLLKNINKNRFERNVQAIKKALSNKNSKIDLFLDQSNLGNHSFSQENICNKDRMGSIEVETVRLDDFLKVKNGSTNVDFIKIDVQGAEGLVFEGAQETLKSPRLKVLLEFSPYGLLKAGSNPIWLLNLFRNDGFKVKFFDYPSRKLIEMENEEIIDGCERGRGFFNLFLERD